MARSNFPAEPQTRPDTPRPRQDSGVDDAHEERPSTRPTVRAPSGRYRAAPVVEAKSEPALRAAPVVPMSAFASEPPVTAKTRAAELVPTLRPRKLEKGAAALREEFAPRKKDPRCED